MSNIDLNYVVLMCCKKKSDINDIVTFRSYIPIDEKLKRIDEYCSKIIKNGNFNSVEKYVQGILFIISLYTNINLECTYDEFDILEKNGLTEKIISNILEYNVFKTFLEARFQDFLRNE